MTSGAWKDEYYIFARASTQAGTDPPKDQKLLGSDPVTSCQALEVYGISDNS
jgi:hypothetical protein